MKKNFLLHCLLLCCMMLVAGTSCSDDEEVYDPSKVDDPEKLADPLPTTDQLAVKHNNTLYYLSAWSKDDHAISDNMINRYKEAIPYAQGTKMEVGDAFFFTLQDLARIQSDADLLAEIKDMFYKQSVVMMMEGGTNEDFNTLCTLLDCYNPYAKEGESHPDELTLWVFSGPLPSASGFYSKLNALSTNAGAEGEESVQTIDDYAQGIHCDMTCQSLQGALKPKALTGGSSELTDLISAYIFVDQRSVEAPTYGSKGEGKSVNFQLETKIWPAYSIDRKSHFYLVNLSFIAHTEPAFYGEWHADDWKAYGCCLTNVELKGSQFQSNEAVVHDYSPYTTQNQSTYTSSVSYQLGGIVNVSGPQITGGVTISNSHTETINDIVVNDLTNPAPGSPVLDWRFDLREPTSHFNLTCYMNSAIDAGAKAGITTCSLSTDAIIEIPDGRDKEWVISFLPTLKTFYFCDLLAVGHWQEEDVYDSTRGWWIDQYITFPTINLTEE